MSKGYQTIFFLNIQRACTCLLCIILLLMCSVMVFAEESSTIAVIQFQNRSGTSQHWNASKGWDLAEQMRTLLVESGNYKAVETSALQEIIKSGTWKADRLTPAIETKINKELGAAYILYSSVKEWNVEVVKTSVGTGTTNISTASAPKAKVTLQLTLVDAATQKVVKTYIVKGYAEGTGTAIVASGERKTEVRGTESEPVLLQAQDKAMNSAVAQLTGAEPAGEEQKKVVKGEIHPSQDAEAVSQVRIKDETITILENDLSKTIDCAGGRVIVNGNNNSLILRGECQKVTINGNDNTINIEAVGTIQANGNENVINWTKGAGNQRARITDLGNGNLIKQTN